MSAGARAFRFPTPTWIELPSGIRVGTVIHRSLPVVEIRVAIPGGMVADEERAGVAVLTGEMLREGGAGTLGGRDLLAQMEGLGARFTVETTFDATVLRVSAPREQLGAVLKLVAEVVLRPRFAPAALDGVKRRAIAEVERLGREDGAWAGLTMLHRELYLLPMERHPYSSAAFSAEELSRITVADCRAFYERQIASSPLLVVVAGDAGPALVRAAAEAAFASDTRRRRSVTELSLTDPVPPEGTKITLVDRPGALESEIFLGFVGPSRGDGEWPAFLLAGQIVGGAGGPWLSQGGALAGAVLSTSSAPLDVARGPTPLVVRVTAKAEKTGAVVQALLEQAAQLSTNVPPPEEVEAAIHSLSSTLVVQLETPSALADALVRLRLSGLPDDQHQRSRRSMQDMTPVFVAKVASAYMAPAHGVLVVAGDAARLGVPLSHFGQVKVVNPTRNFGRERTLLPDTGAPLEPPPGASLP
ncbi:M16 family metallopeptidase [Chondromyces apiculatus]|uniref:M16 family metallopeptidase n=1 Tax=Chondromyces apiculatus TaxID=51 RepID=UPI000694DA29|nr:pitrilysin family protein [Chondromyces apiculatus]